MVATNLWLRFCVCIAMLLVFSGSYPCTYCLLMSCFQSFFHVLTCLDRCASSLNQHGDSLCKNIAPPHSSVPAHLIHPLPHAPPCMMDALRCITVMRLAEQKHLHHAQPGTNSDAIASFVIQLPWQLNHWDAKPAVTTFAIFHPPERRLPWSRPDFASSVVTLRSLPSAVTFSSTSWLPRRR